MSILEPMRNIPRLHPRKCGSPSPIYQCEYHDYRINFEEAAAAVRVFVSMLLLAGVHF